MQRIVSMAFAARQVHKRYQAVVQGLPERDEGMIELALAPDWPRRPMQKIDSADGKPSITRWRVISRDPGARTARVELEPLTGRTHQLRVHLSAIGHAIVGDVLYAGATAGASRLMLHATRLALAHPVDGRTLTLDSPAPF